MLTFRYAGAYNVGVKKIIKNILNVKAGEQNG